MTPAPAPRRRSWPVIAAVLACAAGCGGTLPPASTATTSPAAASTGAATLPSPTLNPATSAPSASAGLELELHALPESVSRAVGPSVASDGQELVWAVASGVGTATALADLASFTPGRDAAPAVFYRHPDRDSMIWDVAVRDGACAFLEMNERKLGENGWRLWSLPARRGKAVLLDTRDGSPTDGRPAAMFALTRDGIVWSAVHDHEGTPTFELLTARLDGSGRRVLLSAPVKTRQFWYPSADPSGASVLYATVEPAGGGFEYRLWSLDLEDPAAQPVRLGASDTATQPVTNGSTLVWRTVDGNGGNWSPSLTAAARDGGAPVTVPVDRLLRLTVGNRFAAFDTEATQSVELYDLSTGRLVDVERYTPPDTRGVQPGWTVVAGDLLVFRRVDYYNADGASAAPPAIVWASLPPG